MRSLATSYFWIFAVLVLVGHHGLGWCLQPQAVGCHELNVNWLDCPELRCYYYVVCTAILCPSGLCVVVLEMGVKPIPHALPLLAKIVLGKMADQGGPR